MILSLIIMTCIFDQLVILLLLGNKGLRVWNSGLYSVLYIIRTATAFSPVVINCSYQRTNTYGRYVKKKMIPPQAAARFARAKNTEIKKHIITVAIMKTDRNTKTTSGSLCQRILPPFRTATSNKMVMVIGTVLLMNHATQCTALPRPITWNKHHGRNK